VHTIKTYGRVVVQLHSFLTAALYGVKQSLHDPASLPLENATPVPMNRRYDGPRNRCGCFGDDINLLPFRTSNHDSSVVQPVAQYRLRYPDSLIWCASIRVFAKNSNIPKLHQRRNEDKITFEAGPMIPIYSSESFDPIS